MKMVFTEFTVGGRRWKRNAETKGERSQADDEQLKWTVHRL